MASSATGTAKRAAYQATGITVTLATHHHREHQQITVQQRDNGIATT